MTEIEGLRTEMSDVRRDVQELIKEVAEVSADVKSMQRAIEKLENSIEATPPNGATVVNMPGNKAPVVGWTMVAMATLEIVRQFLPELIAALRVTH